MAKTVVDLSGLPEVSNPGRIAILKSKWYPDIVDALAGTCEGVLRERGFTRVEIHTLPGSLELPLAAAELLRVAAESGDSSRIEAVICFGVIVKGETYHFEMISSECMRGLSQVMLEYHCPVIVEVLPVTDIEHARARAADDEFNKGYEAAAAAIEMISWRRNVGASGN